MHVQINKSSWTLSDIIQLYRPLSSDAIVVEGFKQEDYLKVVLLRDRHDIDLLHELSNIICAITWKSLKNKVSVSFPIYSLEEETEYLNYIWTKVERFHEQ
ncbi:molybdopterin-guanine dinucleotide biosynthesis protein B [Alteribacillus persepolensis]|uniref:Molybdopterin-guanine dinucleotide biosynthesis protein B n=1 Tax=Alteribacillus persepolensis TaxID=568899 RepID=A0A1G8JKC5_9BACI|nr:molybdopterin-guanine dinucleotide biosynthesis protein MobB [Alteribacillus persepolensis]SDI31668.1 molybdopterin-guanine dinucleotide biosynthesis protein B [Alteribacillus persepolensis]